MKLLTLMRHAKSSWGQPGLSDFDRTLNSRGAEQMSLWSKFWRKEKQKPDLILCSSAARTRETLERMEESLGDADVRYMRGLYNGLMEDYLDALWAAVDVRHIMVIGHNPTCDELARYLAKPSGQAFDKFMKHHFGTANACRFEVDVDSWKNLGQASCTIASFIRPKDLPLQ